MKVAHRLKPGPLAIVRAEIRIGRPNRRDLAAHERQMNLVEISDRRQLRVCGQLRVSMKQVSREASKAPQVQVHPGTPARTPRNRRYL
jgi:hypothetical protein